MSARLLLGSTVELVRNGQLLTTLCATCSQYSATISGSHSLTETVLVLSLSVRGLKCSFHLIFLLYVIIPLQFRAAKIDIFFESAKQTDFFSSYFCLFCRFLVLLHPQNNTFCIQMSFFDFGQQGKHSNNNI